MNHSCDDRIHYYTLTFYLWHTGLEPLGVIQGGGGGGSILSQIFLKNGFFKIIIHSLEILTFVVTTNWLQLSAFTVRNPVITTMYFLL